jgi:hypothetical protein
MKEKLIEAFKNKGLNPKVLEECIEGGKIIKFFENDRNICVLVKFEDDSESNLVVDPRDEYSFQRYFSIGDRTACSVDKNFFMTDAPELIANLLNAKYE